MKQKKEKRIKKKKIVMPRSEMVMSVLAHIHESSQCGLLIEDPSFSIDKIHVRSQISLLRSRRIF